MPIVEKQENFIAEHGEKLQCAVLALSISHDSMTSLTLKKSYRDWSVFPSLGSLELRPAHDWLVND